MHTGTWLQYRKEFSMSPSFDRPRRWIMWQVTETGPSRISKSPREAILNCPVMDNPITSFKISSISSRVVQSRNLPTLHLRMFMLWIVMGLATLSYRTTIKCRRINCRLLPKSILHSKMFCLISPIRRYQDRTPPILATRGMPLIWFVDPNRIRTISSKEVWVILPRSGAI